MHFVIGTPMYGGMCTSEYVQSLLALKSGMEQSGHKVTCIFLGNESLIQRGRNTVAWHFLNTDSTHLIFIDADIKFRPEDVAKMIMADKPIIVGPAPMKGINWDRVRDGALHKYDNLSKLTGIFAITELEGHVMKNSNEPFQIKHGGTGFMMIRRDVFKDLSKHVGKYNNGGSSIPPGSEVFDFFQVCVKDGILLSEDYFFCDKYRSIGGTVWAAPWCELGHFGSYLFSGCYSSKY
jgi:hypothetical protein